MPVEAPPAPPSTTATTPAAPQTTTTTPSASPASKPAESLNDAFNLLDRLASDGDAPPSDGKAKPDAKPAPDANKPAEKTETQTATPDKPVKAGTLRENYDRLKTEYATLQKKLADIEAERAKAPAEDPEKKKLSETLTAREKRLQEVEDELRFANFEKSEQYRTEFYQPFLDAYNAGRNKIASLKVLDAATGDVRQGTEEDFDAIMRMTDDDAAAEMAASLFGNKAPIAMFHREKVQELNARRVQALDHYRKEGATREKTRAEQYTKAQQALAQQWDQEVKAGVEKHPKWFKPIEGDEKGNALLAEGMATADAAFGGKVKDPKTGEMRQLTQQEMVKLHSAVRNMAGAFPRLIHLLRQAEAARKEAETKLKEYEASEPGGGDGQRKTKTPPIDTMAAVEAELTKLAR